MAVMDEVEAAMVEAFAVCDDLPEVTIRRYTKGLGTGAAGGVPNRMPAGPPIMTIAILRPLGTGGISQNAVPEIFVDATKLDAAATQRLGSPDGGWTVQVADGLEIEVTGSFKPISPNVKRPMVYRAKLTAGTQSGTATAGGLV